MARGKGEMKTYVIYFKFQNPGEKKPGPIRHYKLQAPSIREAEQMVRQYTGYEGLEVIRIEEV